ncbi:Conserved hypothetical protein [Bradyrhizobium sp. ORS 285]|nr:hypothetical protein BRAO285_390014 [Bradyrhizobium sp. ORS 285]SMX56678.1 Conserved hypothetical protein [Bradyrhizobium sp. ORS 285]
MALVPWGTKTGTAALYRVVPVPSEPGHCFLVNGITVNKFPHTFESVIVRGAFSPILPSFEESRIWRRRRASDHSRSLLLLSSV